MQQFGLSPKLYPCLAGILLGGVVIALGQRDAGIGILVTGAGALIAGYQLPPGQVAESEIPREGSDGLMPEAVLNQLDAITPLEDVAAPVAVLTGPVEKAVEAPANILDGVNATLTTVLGALRKR